MSELNQNKRKEINQKTTTFYKYILNSLEKNNIKATMGTLTSINNILHLINTNYYYKITKSSHLSREELLEKVLDQIIKYLGRINPKELKETDIINIINNCYFISNDIKNPIIQALSTEIHPKKSPANNYPTDFDNSNYYRALIEGITEKDNYLKEYGNINNIEWDYNILGQVISYILRYRSEIKRNLEAVNYSDYYIISSYIYNAMCYSIMNQEAKITYQSLLSTFKDWEDVDYKTKLKITTDIIEELNLTEIRRPYIEKCKTKGKNNNIFIFRKKGVKANE